MAEKKAVIDIVKGIGGFVGSAGSQALVCGVIGAILPPGVGLVTKGAMLVGGWMLGDFVGAKLSDHVNQQIDEVYEDVNDLRKEVKRCLDVIQDKDIEEKTEKGDVG